MNFDDFVRAFDSLLRMALTAGLKNSERPHIHPRDYSPKEWRRFITGCHRGYAKAQTYMVQLLDSIARSPALSDAEKHRCTFLVRGVAETIALSLLADDAYMIRRLSLFEEPVPLDFITLRAALTVAEQLNAESRLTFALLADLTLSIQIADLVRMDFRKAGRRYEFIELKSGKVNDKLKDILADYPLDESGLTRVNEDARIESRYRSQAKRMLRQRIRVNEVEKIIATDVGTDVQHNIPIRISSKAIALELYDDAVEKVLTEAEQIGSAGDIVSHTIAIAAAMNTPDRSEEAAMHALRRPLGTLDRILREIAPDIAKEVEAVLGDEPPYSAFNLFESVLGKVAVRPPAIWEISRHHLLRLVKREAAITSGFHLVGFLRLARTLGIEMRFATRRETAQLRNDLGSGEIPRWNGRALLRRSGDRLGPVTGGLLTRFLYGLIEPGSFLSQMTEIENDEPLGVEPSLVDGAKTS